MGTHTAGLRGHHSSTQAGQMPFLGGLHLCNPLRFNFCPASNFDTGEQTQARWLYSSCTAVDPIAERRIEVRFGCVDSTSAKMPAPRIGLESERSFQLISVKDIQRASDVGRPTSRVRFQLRNPTTELQPALSLSIRETWQAHMEHKRLASCFPSMHLANLRSMGRARRCRPRRCGVFSASRLNAEKDLHAGWLYGIRTAVDWI